MAEASYYNPLIGGGGDVGGGLVLESQFNSRTWLMPRVEMTISEPIHGPRFPRSFSAQSRGGRVVTDTILAPEADLSWQVTEKP